MLHPETASCWRTLPNFERFSIAAFNVIARSIWIFRICENLNFLRITAAFAEKRDNSNAFARSTSAVFHSIKSAGFEDEESGKGFRHMFRRIRGDTIVILFMDASSVLDASLEFAHLASSELERWAALKQRERAEFVQWALNMTSDSGRT